MRAVALALIVASVSLAGCLAGEDATGVPGSSGTDAESDVRAIAMYGCVMHYGVAGVPREEAQSRLPAGYETRAWQNVGALGYAAFFVLSQRCASVTLDEGTLVEDYHDILHGILVAPPAGHQGPGIHAVLTGILTSAPRVAEVYERWGLTNDAHGTVRIETIPLDHTTHLGPFTLGGVVGESTGSGEPFGLSIQIEASPLTTDFVGVDFRLHVADAEGEISHYAHYDIQPGKVQQGTIQPAFAHGDPFSELTPATTGGIYTWAREDLAQSFTLLDV